MKLFRRTHLMIGTTLYCFCIHVYTAHFNNRFPIIAMMVLYNMNMNTIVCTFINKTLQGKPNFWHGMSSVCSKYAHIFISVWYNIGFPHIVWSRLCQHYEIYMLPYSVYYVYMFGPVTAIWLCIYTRYKNILSEKVSGI